MKSVSIRASGDKKMIRFLLYKPEQKPLPKAKAVAERKALEVFLGNLMGVGRVSKYLSTSRTTIYRWVESGKFPAPVEVMTGVLLWNPETVSAWKKKNK